MKAKAMAKAEKYIQRSENENKAYRIRSVK